MIVELLEITPKRELLKVLEDSYDSCKNFITVKAVSLKILWSDLVLITKVSSLIISRPLLMACK